MSLSGLVLFIAFGISHALASDGKRLSNFSQLCIADQGTGFDWSKGHWNQTNFVESKYIVTKVDYPNSRQETTNRDTFRRYIYCTLHLWKKKKW